ncbi:MAG: alpha/beta hydrolase [Nitrososphaerota archaeon]|jgi:pimeloyl-ACP methyl ester carboxylesterase|nr:alpha/beta hydrolase [Nitrososphaerota archaeon]
MSAQLKNGGLSEVRVRRGNHSLNVRDYPGVGPVFVLMHGFPDNLHIYDSLAPLLASAGRRVVTLDFLGYGESDKPDHYPYTAANLEGDLDAVVKGLDLGQVIPVAHDASGPTAVNWALDHPAEVSSLALLNTYYAPSPTLRFPEFISLFADPELTPLADAFQSDFSQFQWLLRFTQGQFTRGAPPEIRERGKVLIPMIGGQFAAKPSAFPAFRGLTRDLHVTLLKNAQRTGELASFPRPVGIIWGAGDPYLNRGVGEHLHGLFPGSTLRLLPYGHWPQIDGPEDVAKLLLELEGKSGTR